MNKCSENANNKAQKEQYFTNLKRDIEEDKKQLEANLEQITQKITLCTELLPIINSNAENKAARLQNIFSVAYITNFTPKDFTYQTLINSGDLKLIDDFELKTAIEKHYSGYKDVLKAYERQELINKDYLGNYFIYHTDYDLVQEGKAPFTDEKLLKNIMQSVRGSFMLKKRATETGIRSCDSILKLLQ